MSTLAELNVVIGANIDSFEAAMRDVEKGVGRLGDGLKNIGTTLTASVTVPLGLMAAASVAAFGKLDSLQRGINAITTQELAQQGVVGFAAIQEAAVLTGERVKELAEIAKAPGIGFEQAEKGDVRLRSVGISARESAKDLKEFANAIATSGGSAAELDRVTIQLAQLSAKGKVLAQDLRPIIEAAPSAAQALQKLYGTIDSEDISAILEKQGKSSSDFINTLVEQLALLPRVTGGIANQLENFEQGATQDAARLGDSLNKAFNLEGLLAGASSAISGLVDTFTSLDPATQKLIFGVAAGAAALGPLVFGLGAVTAAIPSVVAGLEILGVTSAAALGPIGIGAAAVAAAAYLIISNWDELTAYFGPLGEGGSVFRELAESITASVGEISRAFAALNGGGDLLGLISATGILRAIVRDITVGLTALSDVAGGTIGAITRLLQGDLSGAAAQAQRALEGLISPLANVLGFSRAKTEGFDTFFKLADAIKQADEAALSGAASNNELTGSLAAANAAAGTTAGLLATLRDRLKEVKEQRETETTAAAVAADNALIASLEEQIKQLLGVADGGRKAQEALAKLREELRLNTAYENVLKDTYDEVGERQRILENGVKSLTAVFGASSPIVAQYLKQLRETEQQLKDKTDPLSPSAVPIKSTLDQLPDYVNGLQEPLTIPAVNYSPFTDSLGQVSAGMRDALLAQEQFNTDSETLAQAFPIDAFAAIGQAIGDALFTGGDVLEEAGKALLRTIGSIATQYGQLLIALGVADISTGLFVAKGIGEIAAGTALIAAGAIVGGIGSGGSSTARVGGGGGGSLGSTPRSSFTPSVAPGTATAGPTQVTHRVEVTLSGRTAVGLLNIETDRLGRISGR